MTLHFALEPHNGTALVQDGIRQILARQTPPASLQPAKLAGATISIQPPHQVYDLGANDVAAGKQLEAARPTSFRYLVNTQVAVAAAEVQTNSNGVASLLANVNFGPFVESSSRAFATLAGHAALQDKSWEARLLRISAVGAMAIWLHGDDDLLYPLQPMPPGLQPERLYNPKDFFDAIRPLAAKRVAGSKTSVP